MQPIKKIYTCVFLKPKAPFQSVLICIYFFNCRKGHSAFFFPLRNVLAPVMSCVAPCVPPWHPLCPPCVPRLPPETGLRAPSKTRASPSTSRACTKGSEGRVTPALVPHVHVWTKSWSCTLPHTPTPLGQPTNSTLHYLKIVLQPKAVICRANMLCPKMVICPKNEICAKS